MLSLMELQGQSRKQAQPTIPKNFLEELNVVKKNRTSPKKLYGGTSHDEQSDTIPNQSTLFYH